MLIVASDSHFMLSPSSAGAEARATRHHEIFQNPVTKSFTPRLLSELFRPFRFIGLSNYAESVLAIFMLITATLYISLMLLPAHIELR